MNKAKTHDSETRPYSKKEAKRLAKEAQHLLRKNKKKTPKQTQTKVQTSLKALHDELEKHTDGGWAKAAQKLEASLEKNFGFTRKSSVREFVDSIVVAVVIAGLLRAFVLEAFKIPSGSMIPSLKVGDHLFVNKFIYGLRMPIPMSNSWLVRWGEPERGDIIVFRYPVDQSKDFIKRVVAVSGDQIQVEGDQVYVNGKVLGRTAGEPYDYIEDREPGSGRVAGFVNHALAYTESSQSSESVQYSVIYDKHARGRKMLPDQGATLPGLVCAAGNECFVQDGYVFVMGDNRDNSSDGRFWGGVPKVFVKGKAMFVFWSRGSKSGIRWDRIGSVVR